MAVQNPKVTGDGTQDAWAYDVTVNVNNQDERFRALLLALEALDGNTVTAAEIRTTIINALRQ